MAKTATKAARKAVSREVHPLLVKYNAIRTAKALKSLHKREYAEWLASICVDALARLNDTTRIELTSDIAGKTYHAYRHIEVSGNRTVTRTSRPVNSALFIDNERKLNRLLAHFKAAEYDSVEESDITSMLYTLAMSFCAANDLRKSGDKKTPGTYFELLIAHVFARQFSVLPRKKVKVPSMAGEDCELPTDIIYELSGDAPKFHVPVKLSTRERSIQPWAHQRVLAGLWGEDEFKGLLVILAETKLASESLRVTEILLPLQWKVYQRYIARLDRVYYLDVPEKYASLAKGRPRIHVKPLGAFFKEQAALMEV